MGSQQVLVADRTKSVCRMLQECLTREGWLVRCAANGEEAWSELLRTQWDLVILNIRLEKLSGTELLRRMRREGSRTPVIMLAARPTVRNAVECTKLGAEYLTLPATPERVMRSLACCGLQTEEGTLLEQAEWALTAGDQMRAETLLGNLLGQNPADSRVYDKLAELYEKTGDQDIAGRFRKAAALFRPGKEKG